MKPRVVILGGGVGAVTAAVQLSTPGWQERFASITLYQQGWRLGGKGASGRGPGMRIEEHGLHIWFGFYENSFGLLGRAHAELDALAADGGPERWPLPCRSMEESFTPCQQIALADHDGSEWSFWADMFTELTDDRPWSTPDPRPALERPDGCSVLFYLSRALLLAADAAASLEPPARGGLVWGAVDEVFTDLPLTAAGAAAHLWSAIAHGPAATLTAAGRALDAVAQNAIGDPEVTAVLDGLDRALQHALDGVRTRLDRLVRDAPEIRRAWYLVDLVLAAVRGIVEDGVVEHDDFDVINDVEFSDWLLQHGAEPESVQSAFVRTLVYDLPFAYRAGDAAQPAAEAGTFLRGLMRTFFTYRGAVMWKMNASMGDVIFGPLYELLVKRGVKIEFFHRVEAVRSDGDVVTEIEIDVQTALPDGTAPESFMGRCGADWAPEQTAVWPSDPASMLGDPQTRVPAAVWESWYAARDTTRVQSVTLQHGTDFDYVVFGLSIASVEKVAPDLVKRSPAWATAVARVETVPTQALQLWLTKPAHELSPLADGVVIGGYLEPFDTWADMVHLMPQEHVDGAVTVAYFCNAKPDAVAPPRGQADAWLADQTELVRFQALRFLERDIATLWPAACDRFTGRFDWSLLVDPAGASGPARLDAQFLRANVEPSERYVLSVPGSSRARISPDATGFANRFVAGDAPASTLNIGCVEAATISGMVAANGLYRAIGQDGLQDVIIGRRRPSTRNG